MMRIRNAQIMGDSGFYPGTLVLAGGLIAQIQPADAVSLHTNHAQDNGQKIRPQSGCCQPDEIDAAGLFAVPGFVDLHVHGGGGFTFMQGTAEEFAAAARLHLSHGTTTLLPTSSCCPVEDLAVFFDHFNTVQSWQQMPDMPGVHLEGSYLSPAQAGAQNPAFIKPPDVAEYEWITKNYGASIFRWDYAPELPGADAFLAHLQQHGILPSFSHTDADAACIRRAVANGCKLACHLYSGMSGVHRKNAWRVAGAVEGCFLAEDSMAEVIADGCHLPVELLQLVVKIMGKERVCLVTDAIAAAGTQTTGSFFFGSQHDRQEMIIEDGVAKMPDRQAFAGSIATSDRLVRTMLGAGFSLFDAVYMMTVSPAAAAGLAEVGQLLPGKRADVVLLDANGFIKSVIGKGKQIT